MKNVFLKISAGLVALTCATSAIAADVSMPPPPVNNLRPATYDWTGAYVGGFVGSVCMDGLLTSVATSTTFLNAGCGIKGGALAGYNIQMDHMVFGIEGSAETMSNVVSAPVAAGDFHYQMDYAGRLMGRLGYAMDDNLLFLSGGGAFGHGHITDNVSTTNDALYADHWGWSVGAGWEHAFAANFRTRLDYTFTHFMDADYQSACCHIKGGPGNEHEVRAALIWAF